MAGRQKIPMLLAEGWPECSPRDRRFEVVKWAELHRQSGDDRQVEYLWVAYERWTFSRATLRVIEDITHRVQRKQTDDNGLLMWVTPLPERREWQVSCQQARGGWSCEALNFDA